METRRERTYAWPHTTFHPPTRSKPNNRSTVPWSMPNGRRGPRHARGPREPVESLRPTLLSRYSNTTNTNPTVPSLSLSLPFSVSFSRRGTLYRGTLLVNHYYCYPPPDSDSSRWINRIHQPDITAPQLGSNCVTSLWIRDKRAERKTTRSARPTCVHFAINILQIWIALN